MKNKHAQKKLRHARVRKKISGTEKLPRLTVFRSNKHIFAQIIDDVNSKTLVAGSDIKLPVKSKESKTERAELVGQELAKAALGKKIKKVSFDRAGYKYTGRVKFLADGARKGGLTF